MRIISITSGHIALVDFFNREINEVIKPLGFRFFRSDSIGAGWRVNNLTAVQAVIKYLDEECIDYELSSSARERIKEMKKEEHEQLDLNKDLLSIKRSSSCAGPAQEKTESWGHQRKGYDFVRKLWINGKGAMLYLGMGTGKTKIALDLVSNQEDITTAIVFCPKDVVNTWVYQAETHADLPVVNLSAERGTWADRAALISGGSKRIMVASYQAMLNDSFAAAAEGVDCIIVDESHNIRGSSGSKSKTSTAFADLSSVRYRLCLSGTPMSQGPADIWGQYRFIQPDIFSSRYWSFVDRYVELDRFRKPVGMRNEEEFNRLFYSVALKVDRDVLDLPDTIHINHDIDMDKKSRKLYNDIKSGFVVQLQNEEELSVSSIATEIVRLQQVTSGYLPGEDGYRDRVNTAKKDALKTLLTGIPTDEPVVVFAKYNEDIKAIASACKDLGRSCSKLTGQVKELESWQSGDTSVLAAQIRAGKEGIDLTRSAYVIYYSVGYSLLDYLQSHDRAHRPGQQRNVTYYHLICRDTIDELIYHALQNKLDVVQTVIGGLKGKIVVNRPQPVITTKAESIAEDSTLIIDVSRYLTKSNEIHPYSVLQTTGAAWTARRRQWNKAGIVQDNHSVHEGTKGSISNLVIDQGLVGTADSRTGISGGFDPVLCEMMFRWFCPDKGRIFDPFSGGSSSGLVAGCLGYEFEGCEIRPDQVEHNRKKAESYKMDIAPKWHNIDSAELDTVVTEPVDMVFTSPPYAGLEVYSDIDGDLSVVSKDGYEEFSSKYLQILKKTADLLVPGGFAVFVLGEVRDKSGNYIGFVPDTVKLLQSLGLDYYNEMILAQATGGLFITSKFEKSRKISKHHQNVLVFRAAVATGSLSDRV